jgi:membrane associated rhomboid family serine protease
MTQVPPSTPPATPPPSSGPTVPVCYRHPKRETYLRCSRCDRPICTDCMHEASVGHQCPECVAEGRRTVRQGRTTFGGSMVGQRGYVTKTLIAINVAVMVASIASSGGRGMFGGGLGGFLGGSTPLTEEGAVIGALEYRNGIRVPFGVADGEVYRLLTSVFIHYGLLHLLVNMWALWVLGRNLEAALGPLRFGMLYLVSGLGGSVACYVFSPTAASAGASGALFGLFAALFILLRQLGRDTSSIIPVLIINLVFSFVPGISLAAHLGGLVTGGVLAVALAYPPRKIRNAVVGGTVAALLLFMVLAVYLQTSALNALPVPPGLN